MRRSLVFGLRARNVDVWTALEAEMIKRTDAERLAAATAAGRALYTFNVADYCILHQTWLSEGRHHGGIVVAAQQRYFVAEQLRRLMRLIGTVTAEEMQNRIEFLSAWS